jgi:hypothetical protein
VTTPGGVGRQARRFVPAACVAVAAGVVVAAGGPPRVVLVNAAMEVHRPWPQALAWLALGLGLAVAARFASASALRALLLVAALAASAFALDRGVSRVRLDGGGIEARGLLGTVALAWSEVTRVDTGSSAIVVWGRDERQVRVGLGSYREDQRAGLERAIARHVREAAAAHGAARP